MAILLLMGNHWPDIGIISRTRRGLNVTQQKLAEASGIPQPVISRIESGEIASPSYENVRKIFEALELLQSQASAGHSGVEKAAIASNLMNKNLVSVIPSTRVKEAWALMKREGFSQLPIIDEKGRISGGFSEHSLPLAEMGEFLEKTVHDVMDDPFPIVGAKTRLQTLVALLRTEQAILVVERGKAVGIITAYDLIENSAIKSPDTLK